MNKKKKYTVPTLDRQQVTFEEGIANSSATLIPGFSPSAENYVPQIDAWEELTDPATQQGDY